MSVSSDLVSPSWWKAAGVRAVYTGLAVAVAYIVPAAGGGFESVPWVVVGSVTVLAAVLSLATSLAGLPETVGENLPWWMAALERVSKTFGQALVAGIGPAVLLSDVSWGMVLQSAALAAFVSLLRLILSTLNAGAETIK